MSEKYIDLWRQIAASDDYNSDDRRIIRETLYWLDVHADRVSGRTITAGEFERAWADSVDQDARKQYRDFLARLGTTVIPDPEPTNAEQIIDLMGLAPAHLNRRELAKWLDARGVKAPGDDDE